MSQHRLWTALVLVSALLGCDTQNKAAKGGMITASESDLTEDERGRIVARIGDTVITLADFERRLNQQSPFARSRYSSLQRKKEFLDSLVRFELLAIEAREKGYDQDPDVILARKQAMVRQLTALEVPKLVKLTDITDAEVQTYYDGHLAEFDRPAEVQGAHLLLPDEATAKVVHAQIAALINAQPNKAREAFAKLASTASTDAATKSKGGQLGWFGEPGKSRVDRQPFEPAVAPAVAKAAYAIEKNGGIAPAPVRSSAGWHVVQRTGYRRPFKRGIDEVRTAIRNKLFRVRKAQAMEDYVTALRTKAGVQIDEKLLAEAKVAPKGGPNPKLAPPNLRPGLAPHIAPRPGAPK
jgi:peptidyl-prolyl cis-trans isomerase C